MTPARHPWVASDVGPLDDAAIVHFPGAERACVMTIDVVTPIVDDPRAFGGIAAANSISDVYAMGGRPEVALAFVGFPTDKLPLEALKEVFLGIDEVCRRAKCVVVGGHTIVDSEPKAGLSVTGSVDPRRVLSHKGALPNQSVVLTKALGTGVLGQGIRKGVTSSEHVRAAIESMLALNDVACAVALELGASAATDVTGFGLLGHLKHVAEASGVSVALHTAAVPILPGAADLAASGVVPNGTKRNLAYASTITRFASGVSETQKLLLADAQTSGGLLLFLAHENVAEALKRLSDAGLSAAEIGATTASGAPSIDVR